MALWVASAGQALAEDAPVVVELFTSQGCSSCPAADELLARLGARDDVIALGLHVDYWDYIGWKDRFADPAFTRRQKGYARASGRRSIYTPQMIVQGRDDVVGNRPMDVTELIQAHAARPAAATLDISRRGDRLAISADAHRALGPVDLHLVRYIPERTVDIPLGENAGKQLTYTHIVTDWRDVGDWSGSGSLETSVPLDGDGPVVVLVQGKDHGPIFAAARLR